VLAVIHTSAPVLAGVPDVAAAQAVLDFAVRFELLGKQEAGRLRLVELDLSNADAVAASLPRCAHAYPHQEGLPRPRVPCAALCITFKSECGPAWRTWINGRASNGAQLPTHALS
jgi:hypothetical protein